MSKVKTITTKEKFVEAMFNYAKATAAIDKVNATYQPKIDRLSDARDKKVSPLTLYKETLETEIKAYVEANRSALLVGDTKTIYTPFGTVELKFTKEKVEFVESEDAVIMTIKHSIWKRMFDKNYRAAVKVHYTLVKEVLKQMPEEELTHLGIRKSSEERIYVKPNLDVIKKRGKKPAFKMAEETN